MADGGRAVSGFGRRCGSLFGSDALDPVAVVRVFLGVGQAAVDLHLRIFQRPACEFHRIGLGIFAGEIESAVFTDEDTSEFVATLKLDGDSVGVFHENLWRHRPHASAAVVFRCAGKGCEWLALDPNFLRAGVIHVEAPLDHVESVSAPIGHRAAAIESQSAPGRHAIALIAPDVAVVFGLCGWSAPDIPVQSLGNRCAGKAVFEGRAVSTGEDMLDLAKRAVAKVGDADIRDDAGSLLTAGLENNFVLVDRLHHLTTLPDRMSKRFLAVNVFACLSGVNGDQGVPMVGHGNDHGIDVVAFENFAIILINIDLLPVGDTAVVLEPFDAFFGAWQENIGDGGDGGAFNAAETLHMLRPHVAHADHAESDAIVGTFGILRKDAWCQSHAGKPCGAVLQKAAAAHRVEHGWA